jgi:hypothetical protein
MGPRWRRNHRVAPPPWGGGWGWGSNTKTCRTVFKRCGDDVEHAFGVVQDLIIGEAQDHKASGRQILVPRPIIGLRDFTAMGIAIDLNDQLGMDTSEVDVIGSDLNLFAKVEAPRSHGPQHLP